MKKLLILTMMITLLLSGCMIEDSDFSRDLLIVNQDLKEETVVQTTTTDESVERISITLATGEWPPYVSESIDDYGFTSSIIKEAFKKVDIDVEFEFMGWSRAYEGTQNATYAGTYPWGMSEERQELFELSNAFSSSNENLYYLKGNPNIPADYTDLSELAGVNFGGIETYSHVEIIENAGFEADLAADEIEGFTKLLNGRIDVLPANPLVAAELLKANFPDDFDKFDFYQKPIIETEMHLIISKDYPNSKELMDSFNEGLAKLRAVGEYNSIMESFGYGFLIAGSDENVDLSTSYDDIDPIVITSGEYPPYVSQSLDQNGFTTEIIERAFELTNVDITIEFYSWTKSQAYIDDHRAAASYPWFITDERKKTYAFTDGLVPAESALFYLKDNPNIPAEFDYTSFEDLSSYKVGGIETYAYLENLSAANITPDLSNTAEEAMKKLINGRIDILPGAILTTVDIAKVEIPDQIDNLTWTNTPYSVGNLALMFDLDYPNNAEYIKRFNEGLSMMKASGEFKEIMEKHGYGYLVD